jgi:small-conductance mechanosensitive channel
MQQNISSQIEETTMFESLSPLVRSILSAVLIGLGGFLVAFLISKLFGKVFARNSKMAWGQFIGNLLVVAIVIWTIKLILDVTGAVGVVLLIGGALTGALSLGSGDVFSDMVSGIKLFSTRPFQVGDAISVAGQDGEVAEITLTYTALLGDDGDRIIVRNSEVAAGTIINYSARTQQRVAVQVDIPVSEDLEKSITAITTAIKDFSPKSSDENSKPGVICETIHKGRMNLSIYAYVSGDEDEGCEKTRLMTAALKALKQSNIKLDA